MEADGVWVVYFLDNYAIIVSIWSDELEARRAADKYPHYNVSFIKFGFENIHRDLNQ